MKDRSYLSFILCTAENSCHASAGIMMLTKLLNLLKLHTNKEIDVNIYSIKRIFIDV